MASRPMPVTIFRFFGFLGQHAHRPPRLSRRGRATGQRDHLLLLRVLSSTPVAYPVARALVDGSLQPAFPIAQGDRLRTPSSESSNLAPACGVEMPASSNRKSTTRARRTVRTGRTPLFSNPRRSLHVPLLSDSLPPDLDRGIPKYARALPNLQLFMRCHSTSGMRNGQFCGNKRASIETAPTNHQQKSSTHFKPQASMRILGRADWCKLDAD